MKIEIEPRARKKVVELNERARLILQQHGSPDARLHYSHSETPPHAKRISLKKPVDAPGGTLYKSIVFGKDGQIVDEHEIPLEQCDFLAELASATTFRQLVNARSTDQHNPAGTQKEEEIRAGVLREMNIAPQQTVLEFGPGEGHLLEKALQRGANVIAVDRDRAITKALQLRLMDHILSKKLRVETADYEAIPKQHWWREGLADHVVATFASEKYPRPSLLFGLAVKALKQGGKLTIVEATPFHEELVQHLQRAGFTVEKVHVGQLPTIIHRVFGVSSTAYYTLLTARKE